MELEHILKDSLEHFSPLMDFSLWEDKHLYTELNSPSQTLFEYEPFNYSVNSSNALAMTNSVDYTDGNLYDQFHKKMAHPSSAYDTNIPSPCIHDINESDEFWKDIVNNVDHNILEEKCSTDYCNSITDILSCTPLAETNDLYSKPSPEALDSSFSVAITTEENVDSQDSCFLHSNKTIQEKNVSFLYFDYTSTGCETNEEFGEKTGTNNLLSTSPELNVLTFEAEDNNITNTEMQQKNQNNFLPKTADSHFWVGKFDSNKEMNVPQLNASISLKHNQNSEFTKTVLNYSNVIVDPKLNLEFYDEIQNVAAGSVIPKNDSKLMNFTKTMPQMKTFVSLESYPDPAFINIDSNCSHQIVDPKLKLDFRDQRNTVFEDTSVISESESKGMHFTETVSSKTHQSASPKSLGDRRKPNKVSVSKHKSISSIKIDKKGSFLSLPTNSLSTLMVRDLLQMSGCKNKRSIKELTIEYRANVVKIMQQKQLRLKRMDALS